MTSVSLQVFNEFLVVIKANTFTLLSISLRRQDNLILTMLYFNFGNKRVHGIYSRCNKLFIMRLNHGKIMTDIFMKTVALQKT